MAIKKRSRAQLEAQYHDKKHVYDLLLEEVVFSLSQEIEKAALKIDKIEKRVKSLDSVLTKCATRKIRDLSSGVPDIVGVRVIVLFRSDLARVEDLIKKIFAIQKKEDKIFDRADSFEYMSIHYDCTMKPDYKGPRYEAIGNTIFEVQVRTLCMHAWAAVSHYLDYKSEEDIPTELRKEFNALSGLFFVADSQFEAAFNARVAARRSATKLAGTPELRAAPLSLDAVAAELIKMFPDREVDLPDLSEALSEFRDVGIDTVGKLIATIESAKDEFNRAEEESPPENDGEQGRFTITGVARVSMEIANDDYRAKYFADDDQLDKYIEAYKRRTTRL